MNITKKFVTKHFSQFGQIVTIDMQNNYALLTYAKKDEESMSYAVCLNDSTLDGKKVTVSLIYEDEIKKDSRSKETVKIKYEGKIGYKDVKIFFESVGKPTRIYINDVEKFGFVSFKTRQEVEKALCLSGRIIKRIKLLIYSLSKTENKEKNEEEKGEKEKKRKEEEKAKERKKEEEKKKKEDEEKEKEKTEEEEGKKNLHFYTERNLFYC